jgi:hypothetical protein
VYSTVLWEFYSWYIGPVESLSVLSGYEGGVDHNWFHADDASDFVAIRFLHRCYILQQKIPRSYLGEEPHIFEEETRLFSVESFSVRLCNGEVLTRRASYH